MSTKKLTRLYTDEAGDSRFETVEFELTAQKYAPPAAPLLVSQPQASTAYFFARLEPGWVGAQHPTPARQLITLLAGAVRFEGSTGEEHVLKAGETMLDENTTGKGHKTEVVSSDAAEGVMIRLE